MIDFLFNSPYVPYALAGLAVLVAYQYLANRVRVPVRKPGKSFGVDDLLVFLLGARYKDAQLDRAVAREKRQANYLLAGRLYEDAGKLPQAVDAYLEGQELYAAAATLERMGKLDRAAELYLQSGDVKKGAQVFVDAGRPGKAAVLFLEKGNTLEAARLFGLAGEWSKAGDLYAKGGYPLRAAEAYEKKEEWLKAAECYERHFMENVSFATTYSSTAPSADQRSALLAGRLYEKAGDTPRALQIFIKGQYFKEAGRASMALGQHAKAAEFFLRAEDAESAAGAYEQAGDRVRAANLRGEVALRQEKTAEAAHFFQQGQDFLRAAELFETIGMLAEAAAAYEDGESYAAAGGVFIRAGRKDRAAACYERAGELETAAKLYEEAGDARKATELYGRAGLTFKSGEAAARAGDRDRAIALLQRVASDDENSRAATELLAKLFIESRMPGLAIERLQRVIAGQPVSPASLDLYYWLGAAQEASGNGREALAIYKKILSEDLRYRDVPARVSALQEGGPGATAAAGPAPPAAPAPPGVEGGRRRGDHAPAASPSAVMRGLPPASPAPQAGASSPSGAEAPAAGPSVVMRGVPPPSPPAQAAAPAPPPSETAPAPPAAAAPPASAGPAVPAGQPSVAPGVARPKPPRFVPQEQLGAGPLGVVYRAQDQVDGRNVAMRMLPKQLAMGEGLLQAVVADLKAAAQLSHPNLVKVLGFVEHEGHRCVVTEYVQGRHFAEALKLGHKMTFRQAHSLARVMAQVLAFVHEKGLVHGSIQPSNAMVVSGVIKIADLGLGRLARLVPREADYSAPEARLDVSGDIYAMAAVLYHLLTGLHPRSQPQGVALPLPSTLAPGVPEAFDKLLVRCLQPRVELRLPSAEAFLAELKEMVKIG